MTSGAQLVDAMRAVLFHPPKRYDVGPTRTTGADGYVDCSGAVYAALRRCGFGASTPNVSSTQAAWCYAGHPILSPEYALDVAGALLFMGADHGLAGIGPAGHVAMATGDGVHTLEARGHTAGVGQFDGRWRPWSGAGLVPSVSYQLPGDHQPPPPNLAAIAAMVNAAKRTTLRLGAVGLPVGILQSRLVALGFCRAGMVDADPARAVFGSNTLAEVVAFQHARGLHVDGIVGPETWRALFP